MGAGKYRHFVTVQQATETQSASGAVIQDWQPFAKVWADVHNLSGREYWQAAQTAANVSHQVTMRFLPGLIPKMRILWGSRVLDIQSVLNPDDREIEHSLMCIERL